MSQYATANATIAVNMPAGTNSQILGTVPIPPALQGQTSLSVAGDWASSDYPVSRPFWLNFVIQPTTVQIGIWRTSQGYTSSAVEIDAATSPVPSGGCIGSDGNVWYATSINNDINVANPNTLATTASYNLGTAGSGYERDLLLGQDGNIWFTEMAALYGTYTIGNITPTGTVTRVLFTHGPSSPPYNQLVAHCIVYGPNSHYWVTANDAFGNNYLIEVST